MSRRRTAKKKRSRPYGDSSRSRRHKFEDPRLPGSIFRLNHHKFQTNSSKILTLYSYLTNRRHRRDQSRSQRTNQRQSSRVEGRRKGRNHTWSPFHRRSMKIFIRLYKMYWMCFNFLNFKPRLTCWTSNAFRFWIERSKATWRLSWWWPPTEESRVYAEPTTKALMV